MLTGPVARGRWLSVSALFLSAVVLTLPLQAMKLSVPGWPVWCLLGFIWALTVLFFRPFVRESLTSLFGE